jgi:hypothetical protein
MHPMNVDSPPRAGAVERLAADAPTARVDFDVAFCRFAPDVLRSTAAPEAFRTLVVVGGRVVPPGGVAALVGMLAWVVAGRSSPAGSG